jgi:precorrin-6B methylase 2
MYEQSKAAKRRFTQPAFLTRYFVGSGIDIGAGPDGLSKYCGVFPLLHAVRDWDMADGDAQYLHGVADASVDFVHSSHALEHMCDPRVALANWLRVVKPGGHVIVTVPDEDMYERGVWPSRRNTDHKWTFSAGKRESWSPVSVNMIDLVREFAGQAELERLEVLRDFFRPEIAGDQTMGPVAECAIELVLHRIAARSEAVIGPAARGLIPPVGRLRLKSCRRGLMLFDPASDEGSMLDRYGEYAEPLVAALDALLRPGDVAVDYGAGIGTLAIAMARRVGTAGSVHAFEADPAALRVLTANAALNELDGLHPRPAPVALDSLALAACRLVRIGAAADPNAVLAGAAELLARTQPLLCVDAAAPGRAAATLAVAAALGYQAAWHVTPRVRSANWFGSALPDASLPLAATLLLAPPGITLTGLLAAVSADWRDDAARAAR